MTVDTHIVEDEYFDNDDDHCLQGRAVYDVDIEYGEAEPDVGVMHSGHVCTNSTLMSFTIGGLELTREQVILAFGAKQVQRVEELAGNAACRHADGGF